MLCTLVCKKLPLGISGKWQCGFRSQTTEIGKEDKSALPGVIHCPRVFPLKLQSNGLVLRFK